VTPCNDVVGYHHFGGLCYLHLQDEVNGAMKWTLTWAVGSYPPEWDYPYLCTLSSMSSAIEPCYYWQGLDSSPGLFLSLVAWSSAPSLSIDLLLAGPYNVCHLSWFLSARNGLFNWPVLPVMAHTKSQSFFASCWHAWTLPTLILLAYIIVHFLVLFFPPWSWR
jgi:hypothetical protein